MIIHNNYIKLDYNPTTDVLIAELPDFKFYDISEAKFILDQVVETVKYYNVGYLVTDSRGKIQNVSDSIYKEAVLSFAMDLMRTNLKKIARLADRDSSKQEAVEELRLLTSFPIPMKNFSSLEDCLDWLLDK